MLADPDSPTAVCAVRALMTFLQKIDANTFMEIRQAMERLVNELKATGDAVSLVSGSELFLRFVVQGDVITTVDIEKVKKIMQQRANMFVERAMESRNQIAKLGEPFIRNGATLLTHGYSRVVLRLLAKASETKQFNVIVTTTDEEGAGQSIAESLIELGIPAILIPSTGAAHVMDRVDLVIVGAEGIVESGGILNKLGTFNLALAAQTMNKPFYAVAESFKFVRQYPLTQGDIPLGNGVVPLKKLLKANNSGELSVQKYSPNVDYTPPQYIQLLFTDLGVLTPSAVSDELIKLYQ
eukprot:CFRG5705T1